MALVGRDQELAAAGLAIRDVRGGTSRVLSVLGEAGLGKSALLAAIAKRSRASGLLVFGGRALEHERGIPFAVAVDAFGEPAEEALRAVAAGPAERFLHHRALRSAIEAQAAEQPVALLFDDLHWADEASIEFTLQLLRRPPAVAHLLVFTARPVGPASRLLDAARRARGWESLPLAPLAHADALSLISDLADAGERERVAREAAGNPLFLLELARAAGQARGALPSTLVAAVEAEVAALPAPARAVLEGAAVVGDHFDPELAAAAAGGEPDPAALDGLVAAGLVHADAPGRTFAFRHPLVRRAIYDAAPPASRLTAHERVAAELARRGAAPGMRAHHVERCAAPGDEAAIELLCEAAAAAAATSPASAAHWYDAALRLMPEDQRPRRASLLVSRAAALAGAGRMEASCEALLEALALTPPQHRHALTIACAQAEMLVGRYANARGRLTAALADAPHGQQAALAFQLAAGAFLLSDGDELRRWAGAAIAMATDTGDPLMLAGAEAFAAHAARRAGEPERADELLDRATARLAALHDDAIAASPMIAQHVSLIQLLAERFADAAALSERAIAAARQSGKAHALVPLLTARAAAGLQLLELDAALAAAETAEEIARLQDVPRLVHVALWIRALIEHERDDTIAVERASDECATLVRTLEPSGVTRTGVCNLAAIRADEDPRRAIREILATAGEGLEAADPTWRTWLLQRLVGAAVAAGAPDDAATWADRAAAEAERLQLPAGAARAIAARAEVRLAHGDTRAAAELALHAVETAERVPAPLDAANARLLAARAHAADGDTEQAKSLLQQIAADAGRGGALRLQRVATQELGRLGSRLCARTRRAIRAHHTPLTERERDVADLVRRGHSNKQIAATLYLSPKTVENILTRVYAKLGVRSRTQLIVKLQP